MPMEKLRPHYQLQMVLLVASEPARVRFTQVAYHGAVELGLEEADMYAAVRCLHSTVFYKSMTTYGDHTIWQDIYRPSYKGRQLYIKLTMLETERLLVVSFKRR